MKTAPWYPEGRKIRSTIAWSAKTPGPDAAARQRTIATVAANFAEDAEQAYAHAQLIAAAPDMLRVLRRLRDLSTLPPDDAAAIREVVTQAEGKAYVIRSTLSDGSSEWLHADGDFYPHKAHAERVTYAMARAYIMRSDLEYFAELAKK